MKLDLGCGERPAEGYEGVDRKPIAQHRVHLWNGEAWPWEVSSVDGLRANHVIEHISKGEVLRYDNVYQDALFFFFEEAYRIIKPGGLFHLRWPLWYTVYAHMDPTHERFIPLRTLEYLSKRGREQLGVTFYEVGCDWEVEGDIVQGNLGQDPYEYQVTLVARKP